MIAFVKNLFITPLQIILVLLDGLWSILKLIWTGLTCLFGAGTFKERIAGKFALASTQITVFAVLRAFLPNFVLSLKIVKSYDNSGTAIVTRNCDVRDVLSRDDDFEVVYGPRMRKLTDGDNFFLGMQPSWDYDRDVSDMRLAARRTDVNDYVVPRATELAAALVAKSNGKIDLPDDLTLQVPWDMTDTYYGTGPPDTATMQNWTTVLFWYLFSDLSADPDFDKRSMVCAGELRDYLDQAVADRKANPIEKDDILNRCLALQSSDTPSMSDLGIRNNMLSLLIGTIPTISKACCLAMDELLRRPRELAGAQQAARLGDDNLMA